MTVLRGPATCHQAEELRSIANSVEVAFPDAAKDLRLIANGLAEATPSNASDYDEMADKVQRVNALAEHWDFVPRGMNPLQPREVARKIRAALDGPR